MWPMLLDMTKEESTQSLRCLELEAYASLVTALRAQGCLNQEKIGLLKEVCRILNISQERHKAEVRRVVNDEKLTTIAYHTSGQKSTSDEWLQEGRRLIPLMPRIAPQTAYSAIADEVADATSKSNKQLPLPSNTERKRQSPISMPTNLAETSSKTVFRVPEFQKIEDSKKRKFPLGVENSSLAQHLMCPPKVSRIQQIYRQKSKAKQKEFQLKLKQTDLEKQDYQLGQQQQTVCSQNLQQKQPILSSSINKPSKGNLLQNNALPLNEEVDRKDQASQPLTIDNSTIVKSKNLTTPNKLSQHITFKHIATTNASGNSELHKTIKVCNPRKSTATTKTVTTSTGQKLIVVSNPQSITTSSILQRTLTIPFVKNISVKNIDKFKIVSPNSSTPVQLTPLSNSSTFTTNSKHKVVTVRTNPGLKKVIPLSQLQVLNAKGSIKVLPIGGKIVTKTNGNSGSPIYIVNSSTNMQTLTKSTSSSPAVVMSSMTQDYIADIKESTDFKLSENDIEDEMEEIISRESIDDSLVENCEVEDLKTDEPEEYTTTDVTDVADVNDTKTDIPEGSEVITDKIETELNNEINYEECRELSEETEPIICPTDSNESNIQTYKIMNLEEMKQENFVSNCENVSDKVENVTETIVSNQIIEDNISLEPLEQIKDNVIETI